MLSHGILSILICVFLGLIHAVFILICEIPLKNIISNYLDETTSELVSNGVSTSIAVFIGTLCIMYINVRFKFILTKNPFVEAGGVFIGVMLVAVFNYIMYKAPTRQINENNELK